MSLNDAPTDLIIASSIVVAGSTVVKHIIQSRTQPQSKKPFPIVRPIVFGVLTALALLTVALFAPGFSKGLAWLAMIGAFFTNGPVIFKTLGAFGK